MRCFSSFLLSLLAFLSLSTLGYAANDYAATKYPVVLVHGMFGWDKMLGVLDYFYKIPQDLERSGASVHLAKVSALASAEVRGEELLLQVETILAITGAKKVHLIGHSQGVPTARYVEGMRPELVASITSIAGIHRGSPVADLFLEPVERGGLAGIALETLGNAIGNLITLISSNRVRDVADLRASLVSLSTKASVDFNRRFPSGLPQEACGEGQERNENGTYFYSYGGVAPFTNLIDVGDYALYAIARIAFHRGYSDGLVGRCSSHFGKVVRDDVRWNHLDSMNHFFGLVGTNPLPIYRQAVNRLKTLSL